MGEETEKRVEEEVQASNEETAEPEQADGEAVEEEADEAEGSDNDEEEGDEDDDGEELQQQGEEENFEPMSMLSMDMNAPTSAFKGNAPKTLGKHTMVTKAAKAANTNKLLDTEGSDEAMEKQGVTNLAKKFQGQHQSLIREPVLCMAPTNENWALDIFASLHNSIRREMMDLYFILGEMRKMYLGIREADINRFFDWFELFSAYLLDYFAVEEEVIYPWIEKKGAKLQGELGTRNRMQMRGKVGHVIFRMDDARENSFPYLNYSEQFKKILEFIDMFSSKILDYFTAEELDLPPIINKYYKPSDKKKLDKEIVKFFMEQGRYPWAYICVLTRWMDSDRSKISFLNTHLNTRQKLEYRSWPSQFHDEHVCYIGYFSKRAAAFFREQDEQANKAMKTGNLEDLDFEDEVDEEEARKKAQVKLGRGPAKTSRFTNGNISSTLKARIDQRMGRNQPARKSQPPTSPKLTMGQGAPASAYFADPTKNEPPMHV
mmetsp:Transcript_2991/g.9167  ORF Transcript_2991/g.9167 Transcript_2991/m.9167 type:complete len:489 (+) Transcript_2991:152-1618(+)